MRRRMYSTTKPAMEPQKTKAPEEEVSRESMSLPIQVI
jgi:hypothetical protein